MKHRITWSTLFVFALAFAQSIGICLAGEDLVTTALEKSGETVPYILNYNNLSPSYVLILFPGGSGIVDPHMEDGKLVYKAKNNFLLRVRNYFVDDEFVTVTTNSTQSPERIQTIIDDLKKRFPIARIYLIGTSCELSALRSHFVSGVMEPVNCRRNGATLFPA